MYEYMSEIPFDHQIDEISHATMHNAAVHKPLYLWIIHVSVNNTLINQRTTSANNIGQGFCKLLLSPPAGPWDKRTDTMAHIHCEEP